MKRILFLTLPALFLITELAAQFQVGHTTVTFTDPDRNNREILTEIYYPANAGGDDVEAADGQFPVIVFGHGFVMVWSAYENIWEHLVPQGYIMAFPRTEGNLFPNHQAFGLDLAFLTTEMEAFGADASSILFQHVAPESAVMGHSMGGGCSFLAAEAADVNAVVGLAPAETSTSAIAAAANVTAPTLVLSGAADGVTPPEDHHILIYNAAAAACKHLVSIEEGSHCYFANSNFNCDFGEFNPGDISREQQQQIMNDLLDPWLEQHLKGSCTAYAEFIAAVDAEPLTSLEGSCDASSLELDTPVVTITDCHPVLQTATAEVSIPWSGDAAPQWLVNGEAIVDDQSPLVVTLAELPAEGQSIDLALANGACEWTFPAAVTLPDGCEIIFGCTYTASTNYNPDANVDDGSCDLITGNPTCLGDLNIDGVVNSNDLLLFLSTFGTTCE